MHYFFSNSDSRHVIHWSMKVPPVTGFIASQWEDLSSGVHVFLLDQENKVTHLKSEIPINGDFSGCVKNLIRDSGVDFFTNDIGRVGINGRFEDEYVGGLAKGQIPSDIDPEMAPSRIHVKYKNLQIRKEDDYMDLQKRILVLKQVELKPYSDEEYELSILSTILQEWKEDHYPSIR